MESFYFTIYGLIFLILLMLIYFPKKKINLIENNIYSITIITTLICTLSEVFSFILVKNNVSANSLMYLYTLKILFLGFLSWIYFFSLYVIITSIKKDDNENKIRKIIKNSILIFTILAVLVLILPIVVTDVNGMLLPTGPAVNLLYIAAAICIIMMFVIFFKNVKNYKNKKYVPLYLLIIMFGLIVFIQNRFPRLLLINPAFVLITFVMYFTIENPDVKMNEELAKNRNLIQNAMEDKNNFLFIISTSLRNTIKDLNELSLKTIEKNKIDSINEDLIEINNKINYLSFTVNNVLNVSTMDIKDVKVVNTKYNLKKLIEKIKLKISNDIKENINFTVDINDHLPDYFYGDKTLMEMTINSLLYNAIKYTKTGFIELRVNGIVKYDMCRLIFTIEDSGLGMSISKINELLQDNNLTDREIERLNTNNLNINIIKKVIRKMGGYFTIKSKEGIGTEVKFVLEQRIDSEVDNYVIGNNKILVATPDQDLFNAIMRKLKDNYLLERSLYGQDVLDKIRTKHEYKYILIDDNIDLRALTILNKLKEMKEFKTSVIVILNKDTEFIKKHYIKDGFSNYILKSNLDKDIERTIE